MASNTDYFTEVGIPGTATNLGGSGYTIGAASITVDTTSGWPTGTGVIFGVDVITTNASGLETRVEGSYNIFAGVVTSATTIGSLSKKFGTAQNYSAGANTRVYITISSEWANRISQGILIHADQDGTLKAGAVDVAAVLASNVVTTAKILDANVTDAKIATGINSSKLTNPYKFKAIPAFSQGAVTNQVWTTITLGTETYDTNNNFAASTYTVPVTGFYQLNAYATSTNAAGGMTGFSVRIFKNGAAVVAGGGSSFDNNVSYDVLWSSASDLAQLTAGDTLVMQGWISTSTGTAFDPAATYMSGFLVSAT